MTQSEQVKKDHERYVISNYAPNLVFAKGEGVRLWDTAGHEYLDFLAGIAVMSLGHAHQKWVKALREQATILTHVSNLHYHPLQAKLAKTLVEKYRPDSRVFFCNSGAEANEALIKLARKWGHDSGRYEVISCFNSFHGRTLATLTATGQEKVQKGFEPLPSGFSYADFNDVESFRKKITPQTAAILVEAVQAEGGVIPATREFLHGIRALCDEHNLLMMMDDVQCGIGRTGEWFGFQSYGVMPDAFSLAKGLGGGFPIGAMLAKIPVCDALTPGSHGTTYGGNALACAAAQAVMDTIEEDHLLENVKRTGAMFGEGLKKIAGQFDWILEARGLGLIWGLALNQPAKPLELQMIREGLITVATANTVIRFVPPLIVTEKDIQEALVKVERACQHLDKTLKQASATAAHQGVKS